jgi:Fe-S-cluster containining protein
MVLEQRLDVLNKIYKLYNDVTKSLDVACKKYCSACCTPNVTMTTLEGYLIADHMVSNGQANLFEIIQSKISKNRFKPKITINRIADLCMKEGDPPEEEKKLSNKNCPVLKDNLCPIYEVRPFGCRCFMSRHDCSEAGYAEVEPFVMTLNTLFMQFAEQIDFIGFSGNFADVLSLMASNENRDNYKNNILKHPGADFVSNLKIKVLMVPREHRVKVKPVLEALIQEIKCERQC